MKRKIDTVFIHCSASDNPNHDNVETIERWHLARGFSGNGYHWFIDKKGAVFSGRDLEKMPAAQRGYNKGALAICVSGLKDFNEFQFRALRQLCDRVQWENGYPLRFRAHNEVSSKSCPVFSIQEVLRLNSNGHLPL